MKIKVEKPIIAVIGVGYVGLPLALELAKHFKLIAFDTNISRINELQNGKDTNNEFSGNEISETNCSFTTNLHDTCDCNVYILTVPTPIDESNEPDLEIVLNATKAIASVISKNDVIVYESTFYPGVTEEVCGPLIEEISGLKSNKDFFLGYSPERINPGDTEHTIDRITKVVSAQNNEVLDFLSELYGKINCGNVFRAKNIKTAEASKAIENAQRDINIAFMNEVAMLLSKMDLTAYDVLAAAKTKWNFLPFTPGLVGGHCIGVDPYYLAKKAIMVGHHPEVLLSGRKINDSMGFFISSQILKALNSNHPYPKEEKKQKDYILVMGLSFKENVNDIRNTKVIDIINELTKSDCHVDVYDPIAHSNDPEKTLGIHLISDLSLKAKYSCVVLAVPHSQFKEMKTEEIEHLLSPNKKIIFDVKSSWAERTFSEDVSYIML